MTSKQPLTIGLFLSEKDKRLLELTAKAAGLNTHRYVTHLVQDRLRHAQMDLPLETVDARIDP